MHAAAVFLLFRLDHTGRHERTNPLHMHLALIAFQKRDGHTTLAANPWPTVHDPMPCTNALGNYAISQAVPLIISVTEENLPQFCT